MGPYGMSDMQPRTRSPRPRQRYNSARHNSPRHLFGNANFSPRNSPRHQGLPCPPQNFSPGPPRNFSPGFRGQGPGGPRFQESGHNLMHNEGPPMINYRSQRGDRGIFRPRTPRGAPDRGRGGGGRGRGGHDGGQRHDNHRGKRARGFYNPSMVQDPWQQLSTEGATPYKAQDFVDSRFTEYCTKLHDRAERNMSQAAEIQYITPITKKAKVVIEGGEGEEEEEEGAPNLDGEDETGFLMFT